MSAFGMGYSAVSNRKVKDFQSALDTIKQTLQRYITAEALADVRLSEYAPKLIEMYDSGREYTLGERTHNTSVFSTAHYGITVHNDVKQPRIRFTARHNSGPEGITVKLYYHSGDDSDIWTADFERIKNWIIHATTGVPVDLEEHDRNYQAFRDLLPPVECVDVA